MFKDATEKEINEVLQNASEAGRLYRKMNLADRKRLMDGIATALMNQSGDLVEAAMEETNLPEARLRGEITRTALQLNQYGGVAAKGDWMDIRIDAPNNKNVKSDIRKMQVPLGPVVVFGASNFPFAYSTAGGDTACALAAGCPVIVKAHPAHAKTSEMVANIISQQLKELNMPPAIFSHVHGASFDVSRWLVMHELTKAVGFTGSYAGGKQLFDWANQRKVPIPVFSEMGSTNPVFLLSQKLQSDAEKLATEYAESITMNAGQFCTNPGLIIGIQSTALDNFKSYISKEIHRVAPQKMLHSGIAKAYSEHRDTAMDQSGVSTLATTAVTNDIREGIPLISTVSATDFIANPTLHQEVFGPFSLIVECRESDEMIRVANSFSGQLTATVIGTEEEIRAADVLLESVKDICGRLILNGVPTGVSVCLAMQHGGPFPATTDSRFTSVGADGIRRFTRPLAFQNWTDSLLPDELKASNPLNIWRTVNGELSRD